VKLKDEALTARNDAAGRRAALIDRYVVAFRQAERGDMADAGRALQALSDAVSAAVVSDQQPAIKTLIDAMRAKLG